MIRRPTLRAPALTLLFLVTFGALSPVQATEDLIGREPAHAPGHADVAVLSLLEDLRREDEVLRVSALMTLRELGPVASPAIPALIEALSDPAVQVRKSAAGALGGIGAAAEASVPALRHALGDPHRFVRSWAAMALFEIGPAANAATPDLVAMMESDSGNLRGRSWCAAALPRLEADPELAVPALRRALADDASEEVRAVAALSLEAYALEAAQRQGALALSDALADRAWKVRGNAACALAKMGDEAVIALSQLAVALRDETPYVRGCAVRALGELAAIAGEFAHETEPLLDDEDAHVREEAREAFQRFRAAAENRPPGR